jgi:Phage major capsid protein E
MITMDAFRADAFAAVSLTAAVDKMQYTPELLGQIPGLFEKRPIRSTAVWIEERSNGPALILTQPRSAPPKVRGAEIRDARSFITKSLGESARITADELQNIRAFGSETEMKALMTEVARRQFLIKKDFELTKENWRLTCLQGALLDADGSTIYNWNNEFNQPQASEVNWDLLNASPASGIVRQMCNQTIRHVKRKLLGVGGNNVKVGALCGDEFFDALTAHVEVRQTFLNWTAAAELRTENAFSIFNFGGINWINYRSTDDADPTPPVGPESGSGAVGSTTNPTAAVGVPTTRAKFFPINAGIFQEVYAPAPRFEFVNTPGLDTYSWIVMDELRDMWADVEMFSYPLFVCTMPGCLMSGKRTSSD